MLAVALAHFVALASPKAEPSPVAVEAAPRVVDPATEADRPPEVLSDDELTALAISDINAARPALRRAARSAPSSATRALALRLLSAHDASTATARICARGLRVEVDAGVRRAAAECLGRLGPDFGGPHTPALVAALGDGNIDVVTMVGWALANVGDSSAVGAVVDRVRHPDARVARLFVGYAERMRARLGLNYDAPVEPELRDAEGRRIVPAGTILVSQSHSLDMAASTAWLGLYGGAMGWYHGAFLLSAHGGPDGSQTAALGGLAGAAVGAAAASAYGFSRADSMPLAHTVVQMGTFGAFAGYGAGILSGFPPTSGVAAANLSFLGTLAGTAAGIALVEARPPTVGALGVGIVSGISAATAAGALRAGYGSVGLAADYSIAAALFAGSVAGAAGTLATADIDVGLFPLAGATAGTLVGAGLGAGVFAAIEPVSSTETTGWGIAGTTLAGTALGAIGGMLLPRDQDPLLKKELQLYPPTLGALLDSSGQAVPAAVIAGTF
jgi:hypothetical protein